VSNQSPIGVIDLANDAGSGAIRLVGWALDPDVTTPINVHVYLDGVAVIALTAQVARPDVDAAFARGPNHGYDVLVPTTAGTHRVCVYGIDGNGGPRIRRPRADHGRHSQGVPVWDRRQRRDERAARLSRPDSVVIERLTPGPDTA